MPEVANEVADTTSQEHPQGEEGIEQPEVNDELLEIAKAVGWKEGGPLDAKTFLRTMPDRFNTQGKELKALKRSVEGIRSTFQQTMDLQYQKGLADAEAKMKAAWEANDHESYEAARQEKDHIQRTAGQDKGALLPEVEEFIERNKWFNSEEDMTVDALTYKKQYLDLNPNASAEKVLAFVEKKIKATYPDYFKEPVKADDHKERIPQGAVEGVRTGGKPVQQWEKDRNLLEPWERQMMKQTVEMMHHGKPVTTEEEWLKNYRASGALEGRK